MEVIFMRMNGATKARMNRNEGLGLGQANECY
jgi:hypothetical protein